MCNWWFVVIILFVVMISSIFMIVISNYKDWYTLWGVSVSSCIIFALLFLIITCASISFGLNAKKEYHQYQQKYSYVMEVIDDMDEYQYANVGITETVLKYNEWLEDVRARKQTYGNWSFYFNIPVEEMEYIGKKK